MSEQHDAAESAVLVYCPKTNRIGEQWETWMGPIVFLEDYSDGPDIKLTDCKVVYNDEVQFNSFILIGEL